MPIASDETIKKISGDPRQEIPEAGYRLAASQLARRARSVAIERIRKQFGEKADTMVKLTEGPVGEAVLGVVLAAALELLPMQTMQDERHRLAYNLRVQAYEGAGEHLLALAGLFEEELRRLPLGGDGTNTPGSGPGKDKAIQALDTQESPKLDGDPRTDKAKGASRRADSRS